MHGQFDIFQVSPDGTLRWREAAPTVDKARALAEALADSQGSPYVVIDKRTGTTIYIAPEARR
jgi:hypothetical protein